MGHKTIHEYEIVDGPHNGTYGSVCVGDHKILHQKRAIKRLHHHIKPKLIREEAVKQQAVLSPYVVQIYDLWERPPAIVMEYCPVGLDQYLRDRLGVPGATIPYDDARELLHGILQGLNDAHAAGLVHGDIKPANIRFGVGAAEGALGLPKLTDFGAARRLREESAAVKGSSNWMAPELIGGKGGEATQESDYFSFGILAYLVLSGRHPYYADDPNCLTSEQDKIASRTFRPVHLGTLRSDVPARVAERVMELLSPDPPVRLRAEQDLKAALAEPLETDEAAAATPVLPPTMSEAEWQALTESYIRARELFFGEYRPRDAAAIITGSLDLVDWERFINTKVQAIANCWSLRAFINNSGGLFKEAVEAATRGLKVDEDHVNSLHARGYARIQLGHNPEAAADLKRAYELARTPTKRRQIRTLLATVQTRVSVSGT